MSISDEQIGRNLTRLRGEMSQAELADHMRKAGYKWSQSTVWAIEKGERPLRLTEAEDVAVALDTMTHFLTQGEGFSVIKAAMRQVRVAKEELEKTIESFLEAQENLAIQAQGNSESLEGTFYEDGVLDWLNTGVDYVAHDVFLKMKERVEAEGTASKKLDQAWSPQDEPSEVATPDFEPTILEGKYLDAYFKHLPSGPTTIEPTGVDAPSGELIVGSFGQNTDNDIDLEIPENVEEEWAGQYAAHPKGDEPEDHTP